MTDSRRTTISILGALALAVVACSSGAAPSGSASQPSAPGDANRGLVAAVRVEPATLATRAPRTTGVALYLSKRLFNADLGLLDDNGIPRPYLTESLPQLNTEGWRVSADGKMQTTYRLKPSMAWHDGTPLTTSDFLFSWRVYTTPSITPTSVPFTVIEEVSAPDDRTLVVIWKQPYPDAGGLTERNGEFPALPRHVLEDAFNAGNPDAFLSNPFWTTAYLGLGPYRLTKWEPGAFIDGVAFDGHPLGKAKIPRFTILFVGDADTAIAKLAAGEIQLSADDALRTAQVPSVLQQWGPGGGSAILHPSQWRSIGFQFRPEYAAPPALMDARVRKALASSVNKPPINEAVYDGQATLADSMVSPTSEAGRAADAQVSKYPYDVRKAEQLMAEAGFAKGTDGWYSGPSGGRLVAEVKTNAASDNQAEVTILAEAWRQMGIEAHEAVLPASQAQDGQARSTFPGMYSYNTALGASAARNLTTNRILTPENHWQGGNYIGWSNREFDRLSVAYGVTLDPSERAQVLASMAKVYSEELPAISLFFRTQPWVFTSGLTGPNLAPPEGNVAWNIYTWEFK